MKSHSNSSPCAATFCCEVLRAVLADEADAGLGEHRQIVGGHVLDGREHLDVAARAGLGTGRVRAAAAISARMPRGSREPARRSARVISSTMRSPLGGPRVRAFAPVGEEALVADRAGVDVADLADAGGAQALFGDRAQVEPAPVHVCVRAGERVAHLAPTS